MSTTTARIAVLEAIDRFCDMATDHPSTPKNTWGDVVFYADNPGKNVTRIVCATLRPDGRLDSQSVHAFVDNFTGDLFKAAGWKAPAKNARGNIVTGWDDVVARFDWAGGYLYAR